MTTDTPKSIGISEAASRIEAFLDPAPQERPTVSDTTPPAVEDEAPTVDVEAPQADNAEDKTPPSDSEEDIDPSLLDDDGAEAEAAADDQENTEEDAPAAPAKFTVKIDGKDEEVELKELLSGYSRTADYTRKSMALAEEKKSFEPERDAVRLERQQYAQLLPVLIEQIKADFAEPDWEALLASGDTAEYIRQERLWKDKQDRLAAAQHEQERLKALHEEEQRLQIVKTINAGRAELAKQMPQWKDPNRWTADRQKLLDYGQKLGWSENDLKQTYDPRAIVALYKAMRYDEIMAKRPKPQPSSGPKPAPAGAQPQQRRQVSDVTRAKQRLAKTGRVRDAASIFEQLL